uniref:NS2 protein n=1 Tax=Maize stripe virus TaxID=3052767 RepID=A0A8F5LPJ3_MSTV|nr:NS2 protein [Tenuivirus zeae]
MAYLMWNKEYYQFLLNNNRHAGSYENIFKMTCSKEDHYMNSHDAIWLLTFCSDFTNPALRTYASQIATESNVFLVRDMQMLSESKVKCWLCDKPAYQETQNLKVISLPNLLNGFQFATESYHICMKNHCGDDPTKFLTEMVFPPHLRAYYKPNQKMEHKYIVITNGIPLSKNFNTVTLQTHVEDTEDYVIVGSVECPIKTK